MFSNAKTTSFHSRFGENGGDEAATTKFVSRLVEIEQSTDRLPLSEIISPMDPVSGQFTGGVQVTTEGWNALMGSMTPGLGGYLAGIRRTASHESQAIESVAKVFNADLESNRRGLSQYTATVHNRHDGAALESVYSQKYKLKSNLQSFEDLATYLPTTEVDVKALRLRGRQIRVDMGIQGMEKSIRTERAEEGEVIGTSLSMMNSEDKTMCFGFQLGLFMQHCTNGMVSTKKLAQAKAKHLGAMDSALKSQMGKMDLKSTIPIIDMIEKASTVRLEEKDQAIHKSWVARQSSAKYAESVVNPSVAYTGYHGAQNPSVFDIFCAMTEGAHKNTTDIQEAFKEEALSHKYLEYAMS
jgi:hypothetical protein